MSDNWLFDSNDELDEILKQVKGFEDVTAKDTQTSKEWSMADIDRLIAAEKGEEYVEPESVYEGSVQQDETAEEPEFDSDLFTVQPIDDTPVYEDISSTSKDIYSGGYEVDGQEQFFDEDVPAVDDFDADLFKLETFVMPDEIPAQEIKYNNNTPKQEPLPPTVTDKKEEEEEKTEHIDYRKRFFEKLRPEDIEMPDEDDKEPEYPYDKSGIVVRKNEGENEGDLQSMPTVMAAEDAGKIDEQKTKRIPFPVPKAEPREESGDNVDGQIILTDFVDVPDETVPEQAKEDDIEKHLFDKRKQKAKDFKVSNIEDDFSAEFDNLNEDLPLEYEDEKENNEGEPQGLADIIGEYNEPSDKNKIHIRLTERVRKTTISAAIMGAVQLVLLLLAILPPIAENLWEPVFFVKDNIILCIINALLIIAAVVVDSDRFFDTFTSTIKGNITGNSATVIAVALALIENTVVAVTERSTPVFGVIAVFGLLINKLTDAIDARRMLDNFSVCAYNYEHNMYAVHPFDNESEVFEIGRGLLMGNAEMLYSSNIAFPSDFVKNSENKEDDNKYIKFMILGSVVLSLIIGIIAGVFGTEKGFMTAFAAFTAAVCVSAPVFGRFIPAFITFITNKRLNKEGTMIASINTAEKISSSNAVVLDSADIFDRSACTMHGMKDFKSMRIDVVLLYAAAMVIKSGGPLKECFEEVIDGRQDLLPPVRELVYEDKMGISARIYEQKVLLGNRNMLQHHNITVPDKAYEDKYSHDGRKVIYLACNEQLAAMFVVSYVVDERIKGYLKQLESNGIQILVRTNDVNVTEELISSKFGLDPDNFKILSSVAGRLYKRRKDTVIDKLPAGIIHDGEAGSMLKAIAASCSMAVKNKFGLIIQLAAMVIGLALTAYSGFRDNGITTLFAILTMIIETVGIAGVLSIGKYTK